MKGMVVTLDAQRKAYVCYDTDLMRMSLAWTDDFLKFGNYLREINHPQPPEVAGRQRFGTKPGPGWTRNGSLADPRAKREGPLPREHAKHRGLYLHGQNVVWSYGVGNVAVLEMPSVEYENDQPIFRRTLQLDHECAERVVICDLPEGAPTIASGLLTVDLKNEQALAVGMTGGQLEHRDGKVLGKVSGSLAVISIWHGPKTHLEAMAKALPVTVKAQDLAGLVRGGGPGRFPLPVVTQARMATNASPYVVDVLTEPNTRQFFGGLDFLPDGRAAICAFHGDVWVVSGVREKELSWRRFATGLFQPLGLKVVNGQIYVTGRDQLTRLHDLNGDGEADYYENFNNDTVATENYHEFCLDLHTDASGNFYYAKAAPWPPDFRSSPHHGSVLKVSPDGSNLDVYATGFRAPNGLGMGPNGELTTSDNEGHYMPAGKINWVKPGGFYGMVQTAHRAPKPTTFDQPICWLPKNIDNSGGAQVWVTSDKWGPFKDHMLFMSYGRGTLMHVMHENAGGQIQAAVAPFPLKFNTGVMRGRFNPQDGQLYLCGLRGWQTDGLRNGGFYRVRYTGAPVRMPLELNALRNGLQIKFTTPLDPSSAANVENYAIEQWNYKWSHEYGSPDFSVINPSEKKRDDVSIKSAKLLADKQTVLLEIPDIRPVHQMKIKLRISAADGSAISQEIYGTIHRLAR